MSNVEISLYMLVGLIIGVIFHEFMHGYVAYKMGDPTAKNAGRLTLDPLAHVDPFGTIILPGILFILSMLGLGNFIIGYAKPVPINPFLFRRKTGIIWVSLAGPLTNLALGVLFMLLSKASLSWGGETTLWLKLFQTLMLFAYINILLFIFNLIPIPPLDGSRILGYFLRGEARSIYSSIEPFGIFILLVLLSLFGVIFTSLTANFANLLSSIMGLPKIF